VKKKHEAHLARGIRAFSQLEGLMPRYLLRDAKSVSGVKNNSLTHLLLEPRTVLHRVHDGIRNAGVQLPDGDPDVQPMEIGVAAHRRDEPLDRLHVTGPREIQFGRRFRQAASATFICIFSLP